MQQTAVDLTAWIRTVRLRGVLASALLAAFLATAVNEVVRWVAIGAITLTGQRLPVLDIGPVFLAILIPFLHRRRSLAAAASDADVRLGLSDRLTSFVDFAGRGDVPAEVREAQARDTRLALAGRPAAAAAPIRGWLLAGPFLLVASLAYPYFFFTSTETVTMQMLRRIVEGPRVAGNDATGSGQDSSRGDGQGGAAGADAGGASAPAPGDGSRRESESAGKQDPGSPAGADGTAEKLPDPDRKADADSSRPPADHLAGKEPGQLVSEQVGSRLARVVDPLYAPEPGARQPTTAAGTISIDLVPKGRTGRGSRAAPGQAELPERVTVDLDTLPEQYRHLVKTYFELLAAGSPAAGDTTTPPARSGTP